MTDKTKTTFTVRESVAGNEIDTFATMEEAILACHQFVMDDIDEYDGERDEKYPTMGDYEIVDSAGTLYYADGTQVMP